MKYQSNLIAPDLSPHFKLRHPSKLIMGHNAPSDPDFEPECTFWTNDEAAILYSVAKRVKGLWIDVGARFGWTGAHLVEAGCAVILIDPHFTEAALLDRLSENLSPWLVESNISVLAEPFQQAEIWEKWDMETILPTRIMGVVIDGCHDAPEPLNDAVRANALIAQPAEGVIILHDFWGEPIQQAVTYLINIGYHCRIYNTPNGVALCWRGLDNFILPDNFIPPDHIPDPEINWQAIRSRVTGFDWSKTE